MKNKKLLIILGVILGIIVALIATYFILLTPSSKSNKVITFTVKKGDGKEKIIDNLKDAKLIRSKYATIIYLVISGNKNLQAGTYEFSRDMSTQNIINSLNSGDVIKEFKPSVKVTLKEGVTLKEYLKLISDGTNIDFDEAIKKVNDKAFLKGLIADYWFLTEDILDDNIYYALEGYLFPETYEFYKETTIEQVIRRILNVTNEKLSPLKEEIKKSKYSVHEIITIASIAEKEANKYEDRRMVAQVINKRLELNMSLGMDVTSYYGVQKSMKETLTRVDLNDENPYNTRVTTFIGLPVGPICNPSLDSINAVLEPANTDYVYFVADVDSGKVYFAKDYEGFNKLREKYMK